MVLVLLSMLSPFSEPEGGNLEGGKSSICYIASGKVIPGERLRRLMAPLLVPAASREFQLHVYIKYFISTQDCIIECLVLKAGDTSQRNDLWNCCPSTRRKPHTLSQLPVKAAQIYVGGGWENIIKTNSLPSSVGQRIKLCAILWEFVVPLDE